MPPLLLNPPWYPTQIWHGMICQPSCWKSVHSFLGFEARKENIGSIMRGIHLFQPFSLRKNDLLSSGACEVLCEAGRCKGDSAKFSSSNDHHWVGSSTSKLLAVGSRPFFVVGDALCIVGCLEEFLEASCLSLPSVVRTKNIASIAKCPLGTKVSPTNWELLTWCYREWVDRSQKQSSSGPDHTKEHLNRVLETPGCAKQGEEAEGGLWRSWGSRRKDLGRGYGGGRVYSNLLRNFCYSNEEQGHTSVLIWKSRVRARIWPLSLYIQHLFL